MPLKPNESKTRKFLSKSQINAMNEFYNTMRIMPNRIIRNLKFLRYETENPDEKSGYFFCPFCQQEFFVEDVEDIRQSKYVMSCGCTDAKTAIAIYSERLKDEVFKNYNFVIMDACAKVGITWEMYTEFLKSPDFSASLRELVEAKKNLFEKAFMKQIGHGNSALISVAMKSRLMEDRGYAPVVNESAQQVNLDLFEPTVDDMDTTKKK